MNRGLLKKYAVVFLFFSFLLTLSFHSFALSSEELLQASVYTNSSSGYKAYLLDDSDLLSSSEETQVKEAMIPLTKYGNIAFVSGEGSYSAASTAKELLEDSFPNGSASLLLIDMYNREIRIQSSGSLYKTINNHVADSITDNIYRYASNGDFGKTATMAFRQMNAKMEGRFVETPMRWISNLFLAAALALLLNFLWLITGKRNETAAAGAILAAMAPDFIIAQRRKDLISQNKLYVPRSSGSSGGSSGGGGGFSGGGFSGGGGHSSGGGGHRF